MIALTDAIAVAAEEAGPLLEPITENLKQSGKTVEVTLTNLQKKANKIINGGIVNLMVKGMQSIGAALVNGGDAFKAFTTTVVGIIGDMLIQIGAAAIATGIGVEAIRNSVLALTGGPAIAAGLAMVLLGGALKAFVGGSGGETPSSTVPEAGDTSIQTQNDFADPDEIERDTRTEVKIEVKGDILDRQESGLAIAEVLEEYFATNDGVLATT